MGAANTGNAEEILSALLTIKGDSEKSPGHVPEEGNAPAGTQTRLPGRFLRRHRKRTSGGAFFSSPLGGTEGSMREGVTKGVHVEMFKKSLGRVEGVPVGP